VRDSNTTAALTLTGTTATNTMSTLSIDAGANFVLGTTAAASLSVTSSVSITSGGFLHLDGTLGAVTLSMANGSTITNSAAGGLAVSNSTNTVTLNAASGTFTLAGNQFSIGGNLLHIGGLSTAVLTTLGVSDKLILDNNSTFSGGLTLAGNATTKVTLGTSALNVAGLTVGSGGTVDASGAGRSAPRVM